MPQADIGLIGLAVMGENLVLNMANHGHTVAVFNRTLSKVDDFHRGSRERQKRRRRTQPSGAGRLAEKAATDHDDGQGRPGSGRFDRSVDPSPRARRHPDRRRQLVLSRHRAPHESTWKRKACCYIGTGVSGGEEGALKGPSIMPGGSPVAWPHVKPIFQDISAKVDGVPCCDWVGPGGAGHFVKMVHNGIEYGDMQLIGEAYALLKNALGFSRRISRTYFPSGTRPSWIRTSSKSHRKFSLRKTPRPAIISWT